MKLEKFFSHLSATLLFATLITLLFACKGNDGPMEEVALATDVAQPYTVDNPSGVITLRTDCNGDDIHWTYTGEEGTGHWADLCTGWSCGGRRQSPVNIIPPTYRALSRSLRFYLKNTSTNIVNNGHTVQYNIDQPANPLDGSYVSINRAKYFLLQFHFHAASEHTVNGKQYPAEIHFVYREPTSGKLAVVGVFIKKGAANPFFNDIETTWPHGEGSFEATNTYNPNVLMPTGYNDYFKAHFWYYDGSLTTPPCSEIVSWMVWSSEIEASEEQLHEMETILHGNYRPVQPIGGRLVMAQ